MPKIPRDISAKDVCGILEKYGYQKTRQTGSHIRLTNLSMGKAHHVTIPDHDPIKIGTLNHIMNYPAASNGVSDVIPDMIRYPVCVPGFRLSPE
jgi:predicted RNA binding protein YcfA (HicA-like mRNA interferase family)